MRSERTESVGARRLRRPILYWRDDNFRGLLELVALLETDEELSGYVQYLRLREKGLRKDAFDHLRRFIENARGLPFVKQCELADRLMLLKYERSDVFDMIPTPLWKEFI